jgi:hypothetical protein
MNIAVKKWEDRIEGGAEVESPFTIDNAQDAEITQLPTAVTELTASASEPAQSLSERIAHVQAMLKAEDAMHDHCAVADELDAAAAQLALTHGAIVAAPFSHHAGKLLLRLEEMRDSGYTAEWLHIIATVSNAMRAATGLSHVQMTEVVAGESLANGSTEEPAQRPAGLQTLCLGEPIPMDMAEGMALIKSALDPVRAQFLAQAAAREAECRKTCTTCRNDSVGELQCLKAAELLRASNPTHPAAAHAPTYVGNGG